MLILLILHQSELPTNIYVLIILSITIYVNITDFTPISIAHQYVLLIILRITIYVNITDFTPISIAHPY